MVTRDKRSCIRILLVDDDKHILDAYLAAFGEDEPTCEMRALDVLTAELFDPVAINDEQPKFDVVACDQGEDAVSLVAAAIDDGEPFDVIILDMRMPPGIDGVEAGSRIREQDPGVEIVFVTGYSDVPLDELQRRVPPPIRLHYFNKPLSFAQLARDVVTMVTTRERT